MQGLDPSRAEQLSALLARLTDSDLALMAPALQNGLGPGAGADEARDILATELADRRLRDQVFAPLTPLAHRPSPSALALPTTALARLWRRMKLQDPEAVELAAFDLNDSCDPPQARAAADRLVACAVENLDEDDPATEVLHPLLAICPLARATLPRLRAYMRTSSDEHAAALRLAYRDAAAIDEDAPPRLMDVLAAHLEYPWHALRLVCAVMDRPSDRYLAGSELGRFGEVVLDDVDRRVAQVRSFPADDAAQAAAAAVAACGAFQALAEFDRCLDLQASGPWRKRISDQRRSLARATEMRLRQADPALARALPEHGRPLRRPNLELAPDPVATRRATASLLFAVGVRGAAEAGGFVVAHGKALEALERRLTTQADDLIHMLREGAVPSVETARSRLTFIAELVEQLHDGRAAETVRRRAAAA